MDTMVGPDRTEGTEQEKGEKGRRGRRALTQHQKHLLQLPLPGREVQLLRVEAQLLGSAGKAQDAVASAPPAAERA